MIMPGIHADADMVFRRIGQIKLMGTYGKAFHPDAEQLALQHVDHILSILPERKNLIQRILQILPIEQPVGRDIL